MIIIDVIKNIGNWTITTRHPNYNLFNLRIELIRSPDEYYQNTKIEEYIKNNKTSIVNVSNSFFYYYVCENKNLIMALHSIN